MRFTSRAVALFAVTAGMWSWPAVAQEQGGAIQGVVKDVSGGVLPGATVEARSPQVVGVSTTVTDGQGVYRFPALPPGVYTLTGTLRGFTPATSEAVLSLGQLLKIDLVLKLAAIAETVHVAAESPLIDVKQNASYATIHQDTIARIPKGRDFTSVVSTAPGTNNEAYAGGIQVDGASGSENRFIVDGMDTTSIRSGTSNKTVLLDFVQEVQVKSSGYNAEFGGATGGVINVLAKTGSNAYHGSAGTYFTGKGLLGATRPSWRINPWSDVGGRFAGELEQVKARDDDRWSSWNPVFDAGGPVLRDRLWFYGGLSDSRSDSARAVKYIYSDPVGIQRTFKWFGEDRQLNWNVTGRLSNSVRFRASGANQWTKDRGSAPEFEAEGSTFQGFTGAQAVLNGQSTSGGWTSAPYYADPQQFDENYELTGRDYTNQIFSANLDWVITPAFFVNVIGGSLAYNTSQPANFAASSPRIVYATSNLSYLPGVIPDDMRHASGWVNIDRSNSLAAREYYQRLFTNVNATLYKTLAGQHTLKFGVRFERVNNEMNTGDQYPTFYIFWNSTRTTGDGRRLRGQYGYWGAGTNGTYGESHSNNWSLWAQDGWTIKDKLTINAGLRTEREEVPSYTGGTGMRFGFGDKIAPRFGFAYDVKGDGRWKAYGSFGWFYDVMKLSLPIMSFGGAKSKGWFYTLDTYDLSQITCNPPSSSHDGKCGPGSVMESIDFAFDSSVADARLADYFGGQPHNTIDPEMKPYKTNELTLGVDRELNRAMSVGVRYVRKRLIYAVEDVGLKLWPTTSNPTGMAVYFISNPGYGLTQFLNPDFPSFRTPRAQRDYDGVELRLQKRFARNWSLNASYLWSRLFGNYSGLASSDEIRDGVGRTDPNVSRYFDAPYMNWNAQGDPNLGPLHTDRPHQVKVQATYDFKFGTILGLNATYQSGVPVGALVNWQGYPVFISTRDSLGRTPFQQRYDLYVQHNLRVRGSHTVNLGVNIENLFDLKTVTDYNQTVNRNWLSFDDATFFAGFDPFQLMNREIAEGGDMRYNPLVVDSTGKYAAKPSSYMDRRTVRFMVKYSF